MLPIFECAVSAPASNWLSRVVIACACLALSVPGEVPAAEPAVGRVGQRVPDAAFDAVSSLPGFEEKRIAVFAYLGVECPLAQLYAPRLNKLAVDFAERDVQFVGIFSNAQDSPEDIAGYVEKYEVAFPVFKDEGNRLADLIGAQRTPEVFVMDEQRHVGFCGRIDDQYAISFPRKEPDQQFLRTAIEQLLAGEEVAQPEVAAVGCVIGREPVEEGTGLVTFSNTVAAIMNSHCVKCHRPGEAAPFALTDFGEVRGWAAMIVEVTTEGRMPPMPEIEDPHDHFIDVETITDSEIGRIKEWIENGTPFGDPADLPKPPEFTDGWHLSREPDLVVYASDEPFEVPAEGLIEYQYFTVDPGLTEDTWVVQAQILPSNPRVVHHAAVLLESSDGSPMSFRDPTDRIVAGYLPGMGYGDGKRPDDWTDLKLARLIPAGSKLTFQLHYQAVGTVEYDQTKFGLIFCEPDEVEHVMLGRRAVNTKFQIPPHDADYVVEGSSPPLPDDSRLFSLGPHMHLRGKSFRFEAIYPDKTRELLLDIPKYDFNWQYQYYLRTPKMLPAGTRIHCTAHFDNSADNPANPDPEATVGWGQFTEDEMMVGRYQFLLTKQEYLDYLSVSEESSPGNKARPSTTRAATSLAQQAPTPTVQPTGPDRRRLMLLVGAGVLLFSAVLLAARSLLRSR